MRLCRGRVCQFQSDLGTRCLGQKLVWVSHVGTSNTWVRQTRGYVKHVGMSNTWVRQTRGCVEHMGTSNTCMGTSNTWVRQTRGCVKHVGTSNTWVRQTRGYVKHVGTSNTWVCQTPKCVTVCTVFTRENGAPFCPEFSSKVLVGRVITVFQWVLSARKRR